MKLKIWKVKERERYGETERENLNDFYAVGLELEITFMSSWLST